MILYLYFLAHKFALRQTLPGNTERRQKRAERKWVRSWVWAWGSSASASSSGSKTRDVLPRNTHLPSSSSLWIGACAHIFSFWNSFTPLSFSHSVSLSPRVCVSCAIDHAINSANNNQNMIQVILVHFTSNFCSHNTGTLTCLLFCIPLVTPKKMLVL